MTVPPALIGAWRRCGLFLDGVRRTDHCDVIWLQAAERFADIRLRLDPEATVPADGAAGHFAQEYAFAGAGHWEPPMMTWTHQLDMSLEPARDANPLSWEDGVVVERGTFLHDGRSVAFVEEWLRMTDDSVQPVVTADERRVRIEIGKWAVEVRDDRPAGQFVAARLDLRDGVWVDVGSVTA